MRVTKFHEHRDWLRPRGPLSPLEAYRAIEFVRHNMHSDCRPSCSTDQVDPLEIVLRPEIFYLYEHCNLLERGFPGATHALQTCCYLANQVECTARGV